MPVMGACYIGVLFHAFYYYWAEEILFTGGQFFFEAKSNRKPESAGPVTATDRQRLSPICRDPALCYRDPGWTFK